MHYLCTYLYSCWMQGAVALTIGSVPRRTILELRQFDWLFIFNNQWKWRNSGMILRGTNPTISATAPWTLYVIHWSSGGEGHNYRLDLVIWLVHYFINSVVGFAVWYNYVLNYCIRFAVLPCVRLCLNSWVFLLLTFDNLQRFLYKGSHYPSRNLDYQHILNKKCNTMDLCSMNEYNTTYGNQLRYVQGCKEKSCWPMALYPIVDNCGHARGWIRQQSPVYRFDTTGCSGY